MKLRSTILIITLLSLTACATKPITYNYAPTSRLNVEGEMKVGDFKYVPGESGQVKPNQIRNTALGSAIFEKNINEYIEGALFSESRVVGIKIVDVAPIIHGEINEFLIDDLGFNVDWTLDIRYVIDDCYDETHRTVETTDKFGDIFGHLNTVIKINLEELLSDTVFQQCINKFSNNFGITNPLGAPLESNTAKPINVDLAPLDTPSSVISNYPVLVEELNSSSALVMRQAAIRIGKEKLYRDDAIILSSISVLESALAEGVDSNDKSKIDGLAWCALNLGNSGDKSANKILQDIAASDLPKKVTKHADAAIKLLNR